MSLEKISAYLQAQKSVDSKALPPVELWDPEYCGEIDLEIKADGHWYYQGTIFKRQSLVKLLASVLKKEDDQFFLVTPVEKIKIQVADAPFILTSWHWFDDEQTVMVVHTNMDDEFVLDENHPLTINSQGELYIEVRRGLQAKVHRNVYYQWIELANPEIINAGTEWSFTSAGVKFCLGFSD